MPAIRLNKLTPIARALLGGLILLFAWIWWFFFHRLSSSNHQLHHQLSNLTDHSMIKIKLADKVYTVEVVNRPGSIQQGLSGRQQIGSDGMLFVLPAKTYHSFWMIDMKFPLDLLWFDNQRLVEITSNVSAPAPNTPAISLPLYTSHKKVNLVLEIPGGHANLLSLQVGDQLTLMP